MRFSLDGDLEHLKFSAGHDLRSRPRGPLTSLGCLSEFRLFMLLLVFLTILFGRRRQGPLHQDVPHEQLTYTGEYSVACRTLGL